MAHTLILGGGFGGLSAATELAARRIPDHRITLVDQRSQFVVGATKLWLLDGRRTPDAIRHPIRNVERHGVTFRQARVEAIDLAGKRATLDGEEVAWDHLVVALGATLHPEAVPGFAEHAHNLYTVDGVTELHEALAGTTGGDVLFVVAGAPFKCPPAPYEAAMLAKSFLARRGVDARVALATPEPQPLPVAGKACGDTVREWVEERGVTLHSLHKPVAVDGARREVRFENGASLRYDILAAVPPHRAPQVVVDAGLADASGWIPVDAGTLQTRHPDVWAIGDCTLVKLANGRPLVKAGVMAEAEGRVVAANLAARLTGGTESARFDGKGACYLELGEGLAVEVRGDFFATPDPIVAAQPPSRKTLEEKHAWEQALVTRWLGA